MIVLSKGHDSSPRTAGPYEILASAARTASVDIPLYIGNDTFQLIVEADCTLDPALAIVTPELFVVLPSGAELSLGTGKPFNSVGSTTSGWGPGTDTALDKKTARLLLSGMNHILRMVHTDGDSITYSVDAHVFGGEVA